MIIVRPRQIDVYVAGCGNLFLATNAKPFLLEYLLNFDLM